MSLNCLRLGRMLKNVRHISEGNFYGLNVTNKANNVSLDRKLKTLDACRDAQNHTYRKEEKDLVNTLFRLQKSKDQYHHNDDLILRHFGDRPWMKADREYQEIKNVANRLKNQGSNHSIDFPPAPSPSVHDVSKVHSQKPYVEQPISTEVGSAIHRTVGFTDCVICRLPKGSNVRGTDVCRCEKGPDKGTHHMHPAALHADKTRPEYLHTKERLEVYEKLHPKEHDANHGHKIDDKHGRREHRDVERQNEHDFLAKLHREMQMAIEDPTRLEVKDSGFDKTVHAPPGRSVNGKPHEYSNHSPPGRRGSFGHVGHRENGHEGRRGSISQDKFQLPHGYRGRYNSLLDDERYRNRTDSIFEEGAYVVPKGQRKMTMIDPDNGRRRIDSVGGDSYYSVGEIRSRAPTGEDSQDMLHQTVKVTHSKMYPTSPQQSKQQMFTDRNAGFTTHGESHLPRLPPHHEGEAFHGLIHPDNIINHHHYLPYEAELHHKRSHPGSNHHVDHHRGDRNHGNHHHDDYHHHDKRHFHGYYIHKYDHTGTRQIAHIPVGANTHIAEMLEKQREPDSHHLSLLSNLRHLLSVYRQLDETSPRYPWPSPPHAELTKEEFEKLRDCRYLRLPKTLEQPPDSPIFHN